jgi:O-antigen ligase/tetratricopeptide (TPR) repeat protein
VAAVVLLWGLRGLIDGAVSWKACPVAACLAALFLFGAAQMATLPRPALAWLSPAAVGLYDELLPSAREELPPPHVIPAAAWPAGSSLSLYPGATRAEVVRLLAALLLFAAVRSNLGSVASLRRLAVVALANGAALSVLALLQHYSCPPNTLYWMYKAPNQPFGPFICRNHFPFYVNVAIGLGAGLLLERWRAGAFRDLMGVLNDAPSAWVALGLALCVTAVAFSLSRGGALALGGGCLVAVALASPRRSAAGRVALGVAACGAVVLLLAWAGPAALRARLATVWDGDALRDGRAGLWKDALTVARDFPLCGTGYGTFVNVEPLYRTGTAGKEWRMEHAHNDYLEALVEGGVVRLALSLAAIVAVYWLGVRAWRRQAGKPPRGLVLGALLGFTTIVLHSAVDFGLHIPAIAVLAAVLCAHLAALGARDPAQPVARRLGRVGAVVGAVVAAALAVLLCAEGWRMAQAQSLRLGAYTLAADDPAHDAERLALFEAAVRLAPERADLHQETALAYHDGSGTLADERLQAALAHYVEARDLNPLSPRAHLRLGAHAAAFHSAEPRAAYLGRAKRLHRYDAELYYLVGSLELDGGDRETAAQTWRHSLEVSDKFLRPIVRRGRKSFNDDDWLTRVLPPRPAVLLAAARELHPEAAASKREPFLRTALRQLDEAPQPLSGADLHLAGVLHEALGDLDAAEVSYRAALDHEPRHPEWRYDLARLLDRQGHPEDASRELEIVLVDAPGHTDAKQLLDAINKRLAQDGRR